MTAQKWSDAARRYALPLPIPVKKKSAIPPLRVHVDPDGLARDLATFIANAEGLAAKALLAASKRHINFGESYEGGGYGQVWFFDGTGFNRSDEAMGTWIAYAKEVPVPKITPMTAREAAEAAIDPRRGAKKPDEVMAWLRSQLDIIAEQAPTS